MNELYLIYISCGVLALVIFIILLESMMMVRGSDDNYYGTDWLCLLASCSYFFITVMLLGPIYLIATTVACLMFGRLVKERERRDEEE